MVLACVVAPGPPVAEVTGWARLLAPSVLLRTVTPGSRPLVSDSLPYAVLGTGKLGVAAFRLAGELAADGRPPTQLIVCDCEPPAVPGNALACQVTALAGPAYVERMTGWRPATTGGFTLRVLEDFDAPPTGRTSEEIVQTLQEELAVWPY
jgi:hypothetical protein